MRGGPSDLYELSLESGANALGHLGQTDRQIIDIFVDRDGKWHTGGVAKSPEKILMMCDAVLNATHGQYGEDGTIQNLLRHVTPGFTGSRGLASKLTYNKHAAKNYLKERGFFTPRFRLVRLNDKPAEVAQEIFTSFLMPVVVKPARGSLSRGISVVRQPDDFLHAIDTAREHDAVVLVEEYVRGTHLSVGLVEEFRGHDTYSLIPIELEVDDEDYHHPVRNSWQHGHHLSRSIKVAAEEAAKNVFESIGLRHYASVDMVITPHNKVFILEIDSLPALNKDSMFLDGLQAVGVSPRQFFEHTLALAS